MQIPHKSNNNSNENHLTIRVGPHFEASAGGKVPVTILGLVAVLYVVWLILAQFGT